MKLGKLKPLPEKQAKLLKLAKYLTASLPPNPDTVDWLSKVTNPGVMLNDQYGDCTCAGMGHGVQVWTANNGLQINVTDADVLKAYEEACGFNPADPSTDQGGVETIVLDYWRKTGIGGHKIGAYVALEPGNEDHIKAAINLFGGCYIGAALPLTAQNQDVWRVAMGQAGSEPGSWGGHCVWVGAYDHAGLTCITWGQIKKMSWDWWSVYTDESYACISADWVNGTTPAPNGFDIATLQADLNLVTG